MKTFALVAVVMGGAVTASAAADLGYPAKAKPIDPAATTYLWLDGSWQSVALPDVASGWRGGSSGPPVRDLGPSTPHSVRADGAGVSGGIGFRLPPGLFGSGTRVEIAGSYIDANAASTAASGRAGLSTVYLINGAYGFSINCVTCTYTSVLQSDYKAWNVDLSLANDIRFGAVTITPSIAGFGGNARNNQTLRDDRVVGGVSTGSYDLGTKMRWTDAGARVGLAAAMQLSSQVSFGLSGSAGWAVRHVSFDANDVLTDVFLASTKASSLSAVENVTAFVGKADASLTVSVLQNVDLRGFVGLTYDNKVPGFSSPTFTSNGAPGQAARIVYDDLLSYRAGGGLVVRF